MRGLAQDPGSPAAQEPAKLGPSHCSSRKSRNVLPGPEEAPGKASSTSRDSAQWTPLEQRFRRRVLPSEGFGQARNAQDDELSTVLTETRGKQGIFQGAAALKPVVAERLLEPERPLHQGSPGAVEISPGLRPPPPCPSLLHLARSPTPSSCLRFLACGLRVPRDLSPPPPVAFFSGSSELQILKCM